LASILLLLLEPALTLLASLPALNAQLALFSRQPSASYLDRLDHNVV
jgi:hypothetical protein